MGPTSLDVGGPHWTVPYAAPSPPRFNGADISRCRRAGRLVPGGAAVVVWASMGPTSLDVGGSRQRHGCRPWPLGASMGPTSLDVGGSRRPRLAAPSRSSPLQWGRHLSMSEGSGSSRSRGRPARFNGADISRCRRVSDEAARIVFAVLLQWGRHLSMSEGAEGDVPRASWPWGRHLSMSERSRSKRFNGADISRCRRDRRVRPGVDGGGPSVLQWGRHLSMSEGPGVAGCARLTCWRLQWGRHLSMSEGRTQDGACRSIARRLASMGPTSLDVGGGARRCLAALRLPRFNGADISRCRRGFLRAASGRAASKAELQWGRHLSMSEGLPGPTSLDVGGSSGRRRSSCCFNGADISRCRRANKLAEVPRPDGAVASMGPTSLDVGGRLSAVWHASAPSGWTASMGPTSLDVGGARYDGCDVAYHREASMGPTSLDVGGLMSLVTRLSTATGDRASMGPTSLDVGGRARRLGWSDAATATSFNGADISRCRRAKKHLFRFRQKV